MINFFDESNFIKELEKVCRMWEKAADSKYLTDYYDVKKKFVNRVQSQLGHEITMAIREHGYCNSCGATLKNPCCEVYKIACERHGDSTIKEANGRCPLCETLKVKGLV